MYDCGCCIYTDAFSKEIIVQLAMFHIEYVGFYSVVRCDVTISNGMNAGRSEMCDMPFTAPGKIYTHWDVNKKSRWNVLIVSILCFVDIYIYSFDVFTVLCDDCCCSSFCLVIVEWIGVIWFFLADDWASIQFKLALAIIYFSTSAETITIIECGSVRRFVWLQPQLCALVIYLRKTHI